MQNIEISGQTRLLAVIGHPVSHSLSPYIHNRFAREMDLPFAYMAFDVRAEQLGDFVQSAKLLGMAGFNLTMPLKRDILPYIDVLDGSAAAVGAVNTVALRENKLYGFNTDGEGFVLSLKNAGMEPDGLDAVVLGTGGAGQAVATALTAHDARVQTASCRKDELSAVCAGCGLIVNATPLGMSGYSDDFRDFAFLRSAPNAAVYDLIYAPQETRLLKTAREAGRPTINGIPMLVYQAALAFERFTGVMPPDAVVNSVMEELYEL